MIEITNARLYSVSLVPLEQAASPLHRVWIVNDLDREDET